MRPFAADIAFAGLRRVLASGWIIALAALLTAARALAPTAAAFSLVAMAWVWFGPELLGGRRGAAMERPDFIAEWRQRLVRGGPWSAALALLRPDLRGEVGRGVGATGMEERTSVVVALVVLAVRQIALLFVGHFVAASIIPRVVSLSDALLVLLALVAARVAIGFADLIVTMPGRVKLRASFVRSTRFEFWPTWVIYLGLVPMFVRCTLRSRHPLAFTACNPGIENGGGTVGESKYTIMHALRRDADAARLDPSLVAACCRTWLIEPATGDATAASRAAEVDALMNTPEHGLHYPIILKPDVGQRGFSVRVVRSRDEAERYFRIVPPPSRVLVQPWHPGPGEVGVAWLRSRGEKQGGGGAIYSITLKQFPFLEGDDTHTIEELVYRHPRFRLQAGRFLERLAGQRLRVLSRGERFPIALAGNHCQGTLFRDGEHLITPELEHAIDSLCRAYRGRVSADGLDAVRLDIRYRSEDDLRNGRLDADSIIELNGTFGETTNIYDPDKPIAWSFRQLRGQWEALYALGRERMNAGVRPVSVPSFVHMLMRSRRALRGSDLAD